MKAITIQQPWAHLVIYGYADPFTGRREIKNVENRTWESSYRGPLLIHAGVGKDHIDAIRDFPGLTIPDLRFGACLGIVEMFGCVRPGDTGPNSLRWEQGPWCHQYRNPRTFPTPIPWKGALGLWNVPDELLAKIQAVGSVGVIGARRKPLVNRGR